MIRASHEGLPGMLQPIRISVIEETVLESSPEFPRSRMKRCVVLAAIEEGGSPPLLFPVFQSLLFCGFDLLRSCPVSVSLRKHWRGEGPHHGNNGGQEGRNISAQLVSARFRAFDDLALTRGQPLSFHDAVCFAEIRALAKLMP
jgi:hypothetical protein